MFIIKPKADCKETICLFYYFIRILYQLTIWGMISFLIFMLTRGNNDRFYGIVKNICISDLVINFPPI